MPELPEVEVLRRSLEPLIVGDLVQAVSVADPRLRERVDIDMLEALAIGREVVGTRRRAKYLLVDLNNQHSLVVHLGMSGRLTLVPEETPRLRHEHVSLSMASERKLRFVDTRRFGLIFALASPEIESDRHFAHLGVEPLSDRFDGGFLRSAAKRRRGPVKNFIMNAEIVVGIGNIYACEALYKAGIHPARSVARISERRWTLLAQAIQETLEDAINQGGTTLNDFADATGQEGYFSVSLAAYGRAGQRCERCGGAIRRRVQAGRSTFFCPSCQK